jgi:hypothetical protein
MGPLRGAIAVPLLIFLVAACAGSAASPSSSASPATSAGATETPIETATATAAATPKPTATLAALITPTAAPATPTADSTGHGEYLLVLKRVQFADGSIQAQLWVVRPDGTGLKELVAGHKQLVDPTDYDLAAVWSHDGTKIHVVRDCDSKISDFKVGTWSQKPIATMGNKAADFVWSPDDSQIAYWRYTSESVICGGSDYPNDLMVMKADTSGKTVIRPNTGYLRLVSYWPTGGALVANTDNSWYKVDVPGGALTPLDIQGVAAPKISPDGFKVAYGSTSGHVLIRDVLGGALTDLGAGDEYEWSPDSASVAVAGGGTLQMCDAANGGCSTIYSRSATHLTFSPDGRRIAFVDWPTGQVYVVNSDGTGLAPVPGVSGFVGWDYMGVQERLIWQP